MRAEPNRKNDFLPGKTHCYCCHKGVWTQLIIKHKGTVTIIWKLALLVDTKKQGKTGPFQNCSLDSLHIPFHLVCKYKSTIKWRERNSGKNIKWFRNTYDSVFLRILNEGRNIFQCVEMILNSKMFISYIITVIQNMNYGAGQTFSSEPSSQRFEFQVKSCFAAVSRAEAGDTKSILLWGPFATCVNALTWCRLTKVHMYTFSTTEKKSYSGLLSTCGCDWGCPIIVVKIGNRWNYHVWGCIICNPEQVTHLFVLEGPHL